MPLQTYADYFGPPEKTNALDLFRTVEAIRDARARRESEGNALAFEKEKWDTQSGMERERTDIARKTSEAAIAASGESVKSSKVDRTIKLVDALITGLDKIDSTNVDTTRNTSALLGPLSVLIASEVPPGDPNEQYANRVIGLFKSVMENPTEQNVKDLRTLQTRLKEVGRTGLTVPEQKDIIGYTAEETRKTQEAGHAAEAKYRKPENFLDTPAGYAWKKEVDKVYATDKSKMTAPQAQRRKTAILKDIATIKGGEVPEGSLIIGSSKTIDPKSPEAAILFDQMNREMRELDKIIYGEDQAGLMPPPGDAESEMSIENAPQAQMNALGAPTQKNAIGPQKHLIYDPITKTFK